MNAQTQTHIGVHMNTLSQLYMLNVSTTHVLSPIRDSEHKRCCLFRSFAHSFSVPVSPVLFLFLFVSEFYVHAICVRMFAFVCVCESIAKNALYMFVLKAKDTRVLCNVCIHICRERKKGIELIQFTQYALEPVLYRIKYGRSLRYLIEMFHF